MTEACGKQIHVWRATDATAAYYVEVPGDGLWMAWVWTADLETAPTEFKEFGYRWQKVGERP